MTADLHQSEGMSEDFTNIMAEANVHSMEDKYYKFDNVPILDIPVENPKTIAECFLIDLTKLMQAFSALQSIEFKDFAEIWRNLHFGLNFKNRMFFINDDHENEFLNEVFAITAKFLFVESFFMNVGAVFTMYAIYLQQPQNAKTPIRVQMRQFEKIKALRGYSISKEFKSLQYCIDYLLRNSAFAYTACQTLKGPSIKLEPNKKETNDRITHLLHTHKSDFLEHCETHNIFKAKELKEIYMECKRKISASIPLPLVDDNKVYDEALLAMDELKNPHLHVKEDLCSKRTRLKAKAFKNKAKRQGLVSEYEREDPAFVPKKLPATISLNRRRRRPPKEQRRVGRPRSRPKKEAPKQEKSDDEIDIGHLLKQQMNVFEFDMDQTASNRKLRTRRSPYFQVPQKQTQQPKQKAKRTRPKESDTDSDSDSEEDDSDDPVPGSGAVSDSAPEYEATVSSMPVIENLENSMPDMETLVGSASDSEASDDLISGSETSDSQTLKIVV